MRYENIRKITMLNEYCLVSNTQETEEATQSEYELLKTERYLKRTPMAKVFSINENTDTKLKEGDFILYQKLQERGDIMIEGKDYTIIHESNIIAKVEE